MFNMSSEEIRKSFSVSGALAEAIPGFRSRIQQQDMAEAVHEALQNREVLICEAGTGTGKTLAYLVPALQSDRRVIVSTGTKNLQEQLFYRDLPLVMQALGRLDVKVALLKGRGNYLCKYRLKHVVQQTDLISLSAKDVSKLMDWAESTRTGDKAECSDVSESSPLWSQVTSTVDNCLGSTCDFYDKCYVLRARRNAVNADLVVVNHHLFLADMAIREEGFGELLPGVEAVIFDEAHQLPDVATRFLGQTLSSNQIRELIIDARSAYYEEAGDQDSLLLSLAQLEDTINSLHDALGKQFKRANWREAQGSYSVAGCNNEFLAALNATAEQLHYLSVRGQMLDRCYRRLSSFMVFMEELGVPNSERFISWIEVTTTRFVWYLSPLEVGPIFSERLEQYPAALVFVSATLAVGGDVTNFANRLGLEKYKKTIWDSPFDFQHNTLCYLPKGLVEPRDENYTYDVIDAVAPLLLAAQGRAFLLFTSFAALGKAHHYLKTNFEFRLWVQGYAPRESLLKGFRETPFSLLLGTYSFWEGVDVRGDALVCVVIDKIPFSVPNDPVFQARAGRYKEKGLEPFSILQLPRAVITLKQGVGRLIRDETDKGVLVLCDPRLTNKAYGSAFLESVPPMPKTDDEDIVVQFLRGLSL